MKLLKNPSVLPPCALSLGILGWFLRRQLYTVALDDKGLLTANHPLELALCALMLLAAGWILRSAWLLKGSDLYADNFYPSPMAAFGSCFMAGIVLMMTAKVTLPLPGAIAGVWKLLGVLSAFGMVWAGLCRARGKVPFFGIHAALCLFLLLYLVSRYQVWSSNPQLQDYIFELLALVCLTLFSYRLAAFGAGMGSRRGLAATGLLAVLLCGSAAYGAALPGLYIAGTVWAATNLCRLDLPPEKDEVAPDEAA